MTIAYVDTNILIDFFAGHTPAKAALERFTSLKLPAVSYIEFMAGLHTRSQKVMADKVIESLFDVVHTDMDICREAAILRGRLKIKLPDTLIYATARVGGGVLVTRNTKDFDAKQPDIYVPYS